MTAGGDADVADAIGADKAPGRLERIVPTRTDHRLEISQHRHRSLHQSGEVRRRQRSGGDAAGEGRRWPARHHLKCGDHEQQAGDGRRDRDQGEQQHNDSERARAQAAHEPTQCEVVLRRLVASSWSRCSTTEVGTNAPVSESGVGFSSSLCCGASMTVYSIRSGSLTPEL